MRKLSLFTLAVCLFFLVRPVQVTCEDREISINSQLKEVIHNNDKLSETTLKSIAIASEVYKDNNGHYPADIGELLREKDPYLPSSFDPKRSSGYQYSIELSPYSYEIIATPLECGKTGSKIFILGVEEIQAKDCQ